MSIPFQGVLEGKACDHLWVAVHGIVRPLEAESRRISGKCQFCYREVEREDYPKRRLQPRWEAA